MKLAHVHIKLYEWEEANVKLVRAQEIQQMHLSPNHRKIIKTRRLLNEVTYQILKYPTLGERIVTLMANCGMRNPLNNRLICSGSAADEEVIENLGRLKRPRNSSKMSGHKLTYA